MGVGTGCCVATGRLESGFLFSFLRVLGMDSLDGGGTTIASVSLFWVVSPVGGLGSRVVGTVTAVAVLGLCGRTVSIDVLTPLPSMLAGLDLDNLRLLLGEYGAGDTGDTGDADATFPLDFGVTVSIETLRNCAGISFDIDTGGALVVLVVFGSGSDTAPSSTGTIGVEGATK